MLPVSLHSTRFLAVMIDELHVVLSLRYVTLALASSIETFLETLVTISDKTGGHSDVIPCQIAASPWTVGKSPASMGEDWAETGKFRRPLLLILSLSMDLCGKHQLAWV